MEISPAAHIAGVFAGILSIAATFTSFIFCTRLYTAQLHRVYWALAAYFFVDGFSMIVNAWNPGKGWEIHFVTSPIQTALLCVTLWQLSRQIFTNYPPLREFASKAARYLFPLCMALAAGSLITDPAIASGRTNQYVLSLALGRAADTAILAFLVILGIFAGWFPVRMKRNASVLLSGFLGYFFAHWVWQLAVNTSGNYGGFGLLLLYITFLGVTLYWIFSISPDGEVEVMSPLPARSPELLARRTAELQRIQAHLARRTIS